LALSGLLMAASAVCADSGAACDEIYPAVEKALVDRGVPVTQLPAQEELDCAAAPRRPGPFAVEDVAWDAERQVFQIRIACSDAPRCLPFLVQAHVGQAKAVAIRQKLKASARQPGAGRLEIRQASSGGTATHVLVKPGHAATLLLERDGVRIRMPVTCLERGAEGDLVRVRLKAARQFFRAQVIGTDLVRLF
jgi:hypothetical protein